LRVTDEIYNFEFLIFNDREGILSMRSYTFPSLGLGVGLEDNEKSGYLQIQPLILGRFQKNKATAIYTKQ